MKDRHRRPWLSVVAGGESLVSHAGGTLLVEAARRSGLASSRPGWGRGGGRWPRTTRARSVLDLAVSVALGGDAACDVAVLRAQPGGVRAGGLGPDGVPAHRGPGQGRRCRARGDHERAGWGAGAGVGLRGGAGPGRAGVGESDLRHLAGRAFGEGAGESDLEEGLWVPSAARFSCPSRHRWRWGAGGRAAAPGRAGSNTAADHLTVLDAALAQVPALAGAPETPTVGHRCWCAPTPPAPRRSSPATCPRPAWSFSLGANLGHFDIHTALAVLPTTAWTPAYQARKPRAAETGVGQIQPRDGAGVAEASGLVDLSAWPAGTRLILRKERPHPARSCVPPTPMGCGSPGS